MRFQSPCLRSDEGFVEAEAISLHNSCLDVAGSNRKIVVCDAASGDLLPAFKGRLSCVRRRHTATVVLSPQATEEAATVVVRAEELLYGRCDRADPGAGGYRYGH